MSDFGNETSDDKSKMHLKVKMRAASLKVAAEPLEKISGFVRVVSIIGAIALGIYAYNVVDLVVALVVVALIVVQALFVSSLVSAFVSKLLLDAELASPQL